MSHSRDALPSPSDNVPAPPTETEPPVNPDGASPSVTTTDSNEDAETGNTENEDPENGPSPEDAETGSTENEDPESEPSPEDAEIEETETGGAPDETAETTGTTDDAAPAPVPMMVDYGLMPDPVVPPSEWDNAVGVMPFTALNARAKWEALLKPQASAISSMESSVACRNRLDWRRRYWSRYSCGVQERCFLKQRMRWDALMPQCAASSSSAIGCA